MILSRKTKYLHIALNSSLDDARRIISSLPVSDRIILEAGTPLIKNYGTGAINDIYNFWSRRLYGTNIRPYVVADMKTMDRAETEVILAKQAGASGVIALGRAPIETLNIFVKTCASQGIDSFIDMMNVDQPLRLLRELIKAPNVVLLHRGVDEEVFNKSKPIPYIQINKVLSSYDVIIGIGGGDTIREVQRAVFNNANIVMVWKNFYSASDNTSQLATDFLKAVQ